MKRSNAIDSDGIVQGIYTVCLEPFLKNSGFSKNALAISYPTLCPSVDFLFIFSQYIAIRDIEHIMPLGAS